MKLPVLLLAMMLALAVPACGPEKSADDKNKEQEKRQLEIDTAEYAPIEGFYVGKIKTYAGSEISSAVILRTVILTTNANGAIKKTASLQATILICALNKVCFTTNNPYENVNPTWQINSVNYIKETGALSATTPSTLGATSVTLIGYLSGDTLQGDLSTNIKPVGLLIVKKQASVEQRRR